MKPCRSAAVLAGSSGGREARRRLSAGQGAAWFAARDFEPMPTIGKGVEEIRTRDDSGTYRVIYTATLESRTRPMAPGVAAHQRQATSK